MSRFIACATYIGIAIAMTVILVTPQVAQADETTKIVLIGHGPDHPYRTHCYLPNLELLAKCLRQTPDVEAIVSRGWPEDESLFADARAIVLHCREGGNLMFDPARRDQAAQLLRQGVGLVAIHWATGASPGEVGNRWLDALGGHFHQSFAEIPIRTTTVRPAQSPHVVQRGWRPYELKDEFYIKLRFQDAAQPIAEVFVDDVRYPVGWVHERPAGGRSFGFVGGHYHENFAVEPFRQTLVNGILWTAGVDIPTDGAPCVITDDDMRLTPEFEAVKKTP